MRFGPLPDSTATAKRLLVPPRVVFAAPSYLGRAGTPTTPADLASHSVIVGPSRLGRSWSFTKNGKANSVGVNSRLVATYNEVGLAAAVAGLGLVSMTAGAARKEVAQGLLVRVLEDWDMGEIELYAVFPRRQGGEAGRARPHRLPDRGVCEGPRADAEAAAQPLGRLLGLEPPRSSERIGHADTDFGPPEQQCSIGSAARPRSARRTPCVRTRA
jgi:hypothetical protein